VARPGGFDVQALFDAIDRRREADGLSWELRALHAALDTARVERGATWAQTAERLRCTPSQLTGMRTAKYGMSMRLAVRICQALGRPSAHFVYTADW
jgi:hypothetical protein